MTDAPAEPVRCRFIRADGTGCRVSFGLRDGLCLVHDPARKDAARAAAAAGADAVNAARRAGKYRTLDPHCVGMGHNYEVKALLQALR